ncbi:unnamed protein product [Ambrosiozyma monospora]|uniref:6-O-methylguanine-DNA methyltransferase n=1 Tax=Ambrosiozyma monospora TaxID=43982 RepID=A0A9W7DJ70_AMBMO|nr:unnamed protein product [Ambrosiozyma monospora]
MLGRMARTRDEKVAFHQAVYEKVQLIPHGKVTSYGHIAKLVGRPNNSRQVGQSLKHFRANNRLIPVQLRIADIDSFPWWRVVSSQGAISKREDMGGVIAQVNHLREEGVEVNERYGSYSLNLVDFGWFPLPAENDADGDEPVPE